MLVYCLFSFTLMGNIKCCVINGDVFAQIFFFLMSCLYSSFRLWLQKHAVKSPDDSIQAVNENPTTMPHHWDMTRVGMQWIVK